MCCDCCTSADLVACCRTAVVTAPPCFSGDTRVVVQESATPMAMRDVKTGQHILCVDSGVDMTTPGGLKFCEVMNWVSLGGTVLAEGYRVCTWCNCMLQVVKKHLSADGVLQKMHCLCPIVIPGRTINQGSPDMYVCHTH
jgi:hypothetical protein